MSTPPLIPVLINRFGRSVPPLATRRQITGRRAIALLCSIMGAIAIGGCGNSVSTAPDRASDPSDPAPAPPALATATDTPTAQLALHLSQSGAVMYGAYWCPHCNSQKELFGDAAALLPYVECDPEGENAQPDRCQAANIQGYPTWVIKDQAYPGVQSLEQLAAYSQYPGDPGELSP